MRKFMCSSPVGVVRKHTTLRTPERREISRVSKSIGDGNGVLTKDREDASSPKKAAGRVKRNGGLDNHLKVADREIGNLGIGTRVAMNV